MQDQGAVIYRDGATCIGLERDGELVAGTLYDYYNGASIMASIAIAGPITRRWLWAIFHYPFVHLGVNVILGLVAEGNVKSRHLCDRLGFSLVTQIPQADPSGAMLLYTMQKDACRFLKRSYYVKGR
jgi:RimJ/RimL family protein N-acetyltransferase